MRLIALLLLVSCAAVNPYAYEELQACPVGMTREEHLSGVVRCRAMCSSYSRDFASFDEDCKCRCRPPGGSPYRSQPRATTEILWGGP